MVAALRSRAFRWLTALLLGLVASPVAATNYDVGPGLALGAIADVPWESLGPGDLVRIHYRAEAYREKWVIGRSGTAQAPIVVRGVLGPNGERPRHLVIRNCVLHDSGNGLFVGAYYGDTRDIAIEGNGIHGNGNVGSLFEHNTHTAAIGIVYADNRFGPLRAGALGNNLKDRSAGLVVRNNWIEGGNRQLDLVDGEDSQLIVDDPSYRETFVYGNVLIEPDGAGNTTLLRRSSAAAFLVAVASLGLRSRLRA